MCSLADAAMADDDAAEGDGMNTSESDREYGDAAMDAGPAVVKGDAHGALVPAGDFGQGQAAGDSGQLPHLPNQVLNEVRLRAPDEPHRFLLCS